jgi:hypothetical protein
MGVVQFLLGIQLVGNQRTILGAISCLVLMAAGMANISTVSRSSSQFGFILFYRTDSVVFIPNLVVYCVMLIYELAEIRGTSQGEAQTVLQRQNR